MSVAIATKGYFIPQIGGGTVAAAPFSGGGGFIPPQPPRMVIVRMEEDEEYPFAVVTDITNGINGEI